VSGATAIEPVGRRVPDPERPLRPVEVFVRFATLVLGTATVVAGIVVLGGWAWVLVVASVIAIVMLHEAGHFVTAKWSGMKATEFFVGFGPRLWSFKRGETEYGFKALQLGGYVKILGMTSAEELEPSDEPRSFINQSTPKRVLVASAGSIVHLLLALVLAFVALFWIGQPTPHNYVQILGLYSQTKAKSPAELAGLRTGDEVLTVDGHTATETSLVSSIRDSLGRPVHLLVRRDGHLLSLTATPAPSTTDSHTGYLGIDIGVSSYLRHPGVQESFVGSGSLIWQVLDATGHAFGTAFSPSGLSSLAHQVVNSKAAVQARANGASTVSMIGALELGVDAAHAGMLPFLGLLISLNISLGLLNMLPMLPLDGGHVAIALYERIRTRKGRARYRADVTKLMPAVYIFLGFLVLFVAGKMYLDVAHGVPNPFR
jgi:membrane-associated protease RseP (regulator of RpoE activity)